MSIKGLGTDIVEIVRIEKSIAKTKRLAQRVLTELELSIFESHSDPARYLAKRWAGKEAAAKALGTGIGRGISFQHFEISNDELGAPKLVLTDAAKDVADSKGIKEVLISISDEVHYAMATVIFS